MGTVIHGRFGGSAARAVRPARLALSDAERARELFLRADAIDEDPSRYAEAEECYRRSLALDPSCARAWTNLGNVRFRRGDARQAAAFYAKALAIDPRQPEANYNLGYVYLDEGRVDAAIGCFHLALACDPEFADAHFNMAYALEEMGDKARAASHWRAFLALAPSSEWAPSARERLAAATGLRVVGGGP